MYKASNRKKYGLKPDVRCWLAEQLDLLAKTDTNSYMITVPGTNCIYNVNKEGVIEFKKRMGVKYVQK